MKSIPQDVMACLKLCLTVSVIATAMGCYIKNPKYPQSWPTVSETKEIESQIEGKYLCAGEIVESNTALWPKNSVTDFLIGGKDPPACEMFEIRRATPDTIEIRYLGYDADGKKQIFNRGKDYHVEDNWVVLKSTGSLAAENIVMAYDSITPRLTTNSENDLIMNSKNATTGTIMIIIPAGTYGSDWGRFERMNKVKASEKLKTVSPDPEYTKIDVKTLEEVFCGTNKARLCNDPFSNNKQKEWIDCEPEMKFYLIRWSGNPGYTWGKVIIHKKGEFFKGGWIENTELLTREEWESR